MLLIETALMHEARPLIEALGLKSTGEHPFPCYMDEKYLLVVSGVGTLQASSALSWACGKFSRLTGAINIGICGGSEAYSRCGEWYFINQIRDEVTGKSYFPDIIWDHGFEERSLNTVQSPAFNGITDEFLVDMEGSGFMSAGARFFMGHQKVLLKWVSDYGSKIESPADLWRDYRNGIDVAIGFLDRWNWGYQESITLDEQWESVRVDVTKRMRLTKTQEIAFSEWLVGYFRRNGNLHKIRGFLIQSPPVHKHQREKLFNELRNVLS